MLKSTEKEIKDKKRELRKLSKQLKKLTLLCTHDYMLYPFGNSCACCLSCKEIVKLDENIKSNVHLINLLEVLNEMDINPSNINYDVIFLEIYKKLQECFSDLLTEENDKKPSLIISLIENKIKEIVNDYCYPEQTSIRK